jgi:hypothetical protein
MKIMMRPFGRFWKEAICILALFIASTFVGDYIITKRDLSLAQNRIIALDVEKLAVTRRFDILVHDDQVQLDSIKELEVRRSDAVKQILQGQTNIKDLVIAKCK